MWLVHLLRVQVVPQDSSIYLWCLVHRTLGTEVRGAYQPCTGTRFILTNATASHGAVLQVFYLQPCTKWLIRRGSVHMFDFGPCLTAILHRDRWLPCHYILPYHMTTYCSLTILPLHTALPYRYILLADFPATACCSLTVLPLHSAH